MPSWTSVGPLSIQGAPPPQKIQGASLSNLRLRVLSTDVGGPLLGYAYVNPQSVEAWRDVLAPSCFVCLTSGSDCMLTLRVADDVEAGCIKIDSVQQHNLHVVSGETYSFSVFTPPETARFELAEVEAEVRLMPRDSDDVLDNEDGEESRRNHDVELPKVDASRLAQQLSREWFGRVVAVNQLIPLRVGTLDLLLRVAAAETLVGEQRAQALAYHCFRGLLTPDTEVYLREASDAGGSSIAGTVSGPAHGRPTHLRNGISLINARPRPAEGSSTHIIQVETNDGESFPVARALLRPCIALTKAVRSQEIESVPVDIDTATFDRVLIFLEAQALGRSTPGFAAHLLEGLLRAAAVLGLRSLLDDCQNRLGELESRLRLYSFEEIRTKNGAGECWLLLDGMVLDVTRWLPEHPGGSTIIPAQALNLDCSRFYEVYHSSRESFLYIKQFYMGELRPEERELVPCPQQPSDDFLQHLHEYTAAFRMAVDQEPKAFRSF